MAKSIAQAEAELRTAALEHADAYEAYAVAFERNGDLQRAMDRKPGEKDPGMCSETETLCRAVNQKSDLLNAAAKALRDAVRAEQRAEAL